MIRHLQIYYYIDCNCMPIFSFTWMHFESLLFYFAYPQLQYIKGLSFIGLWTQLNIFTLQQKSLFLTADIEIKYLIWLYSTLQVNPSGLNNPSGLFTLPGWRGVGYSLVINLILFHSLFLSLFEWFLTLHDRKK